MLTLPKLRELAALLPENPCLFNLVNDEARRLAAVALLRLVCEEPGPC